MLCLEIIKMSKKTLKELTLKEKLEVIDYIKTSTYREASLKFHVSKSTVGNILKRKDEYVERFREENENLQRKRPKTMYDEINTTCYEWFKQMRAANARLSVPIIQTCAKNIAVKLGLNEFQASNGWLEKFRQRYGINYKSLCGEVNEISESDIAKFRAQFASMVEGYEQQNWFNADELGLFFKLMPDKSMVLKNEKCCSGKLSKDRLTVLLCASAVGEKLPPLVIGKAAKPRAFKNLKICDLPVIWKSNKSAWMTGSIFEEWVREVDVTMQKKNRKIILTVDNCPAHVEVKGLTNVALRFLPPRMTSAIQPLDQGIIKTFKSHYRGNLLKNVINKLELVGTGDLTATEISNKINVLDAISWVDSAWRQVSTDCISKCFKKAGFLIQPDSNEELGELLPVVHNPLLPISANEFEEFVCTDDDMAICCQPNEMDILNSILEREVVEEEEGPNPVQESEEVSVQDAVKSISMLKNFALCSLPVIFHHVTQIEQKIDDFVLNARKTQSKIPDYFKTSN